MNDIDEFKKIMKSEIDFYFNREEYTEICECVRKWEYGRKPPGKLGEIYEKLEKINKKYTLYLPLYLSKEIISTSEDTSLDSLIEDEEDVAYGVMKFLNDFSLVRDEEVFDAFIRILEICCTYPTEEIEKLLNSKNVSQDELVEEVTIGINNYLKKECKATNNFLYDDKVEHVIKESMANMKNISVLCKKLDASDYEFRWYVAKEFLDLFHDESIYSDKFFAKYKEETLSKKEIIEKHCFDVSVGDKGLSVDYIIEEDIVYNIINQYIQNRM